MDYLTNPFMLRALELARKAGRQGEIPVGAVVVKKGRIIAEGWNTREQDHDPAGHAEMMAIRRAALFLGDWRLTGCALYVTLEPCPMCCGAILNARLQAVYFGSYDLQRGGVCSALEMLSLKGFPRMDYYGGIMERECGRLLEEFFPVLRAQEKADGTI